jgi:DNA polymerase elongation subunit (family B)
MYRNCVYNNRTKSIHLWTWDAQGNRCFQELEFNPYLYLEAKDGPAKSIYGTSLKKKEFNTKWDRDKFVKESGIKRIFENLPPYQQFLIDNYYHCSEDPTFSQFPLKILFIDIECPGIPGGKFPEAELAENEINLLTLYDSLSKTYNVFGLKEYTPKNKNVNYIHCKSEIDLLKRVIMFISSDYPDCLVGFNSANFDIKYLVNRITFQLDEDWAKMLSPLERIYEKFNKTGKFGMPTKEYVIEGISCLDYYVLYKKFALEPLESYKLDFIAEVELDENKVEYEGTLAELAIRDWETYVDYNIKDVEILVKLDDKLRYIELLRFISYLGLCNMENAINTVPVINGAVAIRARNRGEKIPTFVTVNAEGKIPGGHVAEPKMGFSKSIVSFDANSLYPSVMISLNTSPETKIGSVEHIGEKYVIKHVSGRTFEMTKENYAKYVKEEKLSKSEAGILFTQKKKGIMPEFLEFLYTKRKQMKSEMLKLQKEYESKKKSLPKDKQSEWETNIQKLDTFQNAYKITLNSTYGYCVNNYAPLADKEIGASVTLTGQSVIKKSNELLIEFLKQEYPDLGDRAEQVVIYNDTDSCYITLDVLKDFGVELLDGDKVSQKFYEVCDKIGDYINAGCNAWAKRRLWSQDPRFVFKRESICDFGIFIAKKYYALHILDSEGTPVNKYKYKGVDVVKSTMPKVIKPYLKNVIETMISTQSLKETNEAFNKVYDKYVAMGIDGVYTTVSLNTFNKYVNKIKGLECPSKTPGQVVAANAYNVLLEKLNIEDKYEKFKEGEKAKLLYVKTPNRYGIKRIAFKNKYPEEFDEIFEIDYRLMFHKVVFEAIDRFYRAVNWKLRKPTENVKIELEDFFR